MLTVTEAAQEVIKRLVLSGEAPDGGLRVAVKMGGCAGFQYSMAIEQGPTDTDAVVEEGGAKLFLDPESQALLNGTTLDFTESVEASGFNFINPNAANKCSCGKSFSA